MYPTGSTFKPIVAEAALAAGLIGPYSTLPCTSTYTVGNHVFRNVEAGVNASLTLAQALSISCDTWFYRLGSMFYSAPAARPPLHAGLGAAARRRPSDRLRCSRRGSPASSRRRRG